MAYSTDVIALSPLWYFICDDSNTTIVDSGTAGNNLLAASLAPDYNAPDLINEAGSLGFTGTNSQRLEDTVTNGGYSNSGTFTVMAAVKCDNISTTPAVIHVGDFANGSNRGWYWAITATGAMQITGWASGSSKSVVGTAGAYTNDEIALLGIVMTPTSMKIWKNGVLLETVVHSNTYNNNTATPPLRVCCLKGASNQNYFGGDLGHVAFFNNTALSDENMLALANASGLGPGGGGGDPFTGYSRADARRAYFTFREYTGTAADQEVQWLQASGATSSNRMDAWGEMLAANLTSPSGNITDDWMSLMVVQGISRGNINDMEKEFWTLNQDIAAE